jgi:hypothetical protein
MLLLGKGVVQYILHLLLAIHFLATILILKWLSIGLAINLISLEDYCVLHHTQPRSRDLIRVV